MVREGGVLKEWWWCGGGIRGRAEHGQARDRQPLCDVETVSTACASFFSWLKLQGVILLSVVRLSAGG